MFTGISYPPHPRRFPLLPGFSFCRFSHHLVVRLPGLRMIKAMWEEEECVRRTNYERECQLEAKIVGDKKRNPISQSLKTEAKGGFEAEKADLSGKLILG